MKERLRNNPIIKRVRGHAALPVLFRESEKAGVSLQTKTPKEAVVPDKDTHVVRASLAGPVDAVEAAVIQATAARPFETEAWSDQHTEEQFLPASDQPRPTLPTNTKAPPSSPTPESQAQMIEKQEPGWRRLQTIMRKHKQRENETQERMVEETETSGGSDVGASEPTAEPVRSASEENIQRTKVEPVTLVETTETTEKEPAVEPRQPRQQLLSEGKKGQSSKSKAEPFSTQLAPDEPIQPVFQEKPLLGETPDASSAVRERELPGRPAPVSRAKTTDEPSPEPSTNEDSIEVTAVRRTPEPTDPNMTEATVKQDAEPAADSPIAGGREALPDDEIHSQTEAADTELSRTQAEPPAQQSLPLEDAWPVQRQETPQRQPQSVVEETHSVAPSAQPDQASEDRVSQALSKVASGRPTDSSVELVLSRSAPKPRPDLVKAEKRGPSFIQRQPREQETMERSPTPDPGTVQTEIGPLPGDLWRLLDQRPPSGEEQRLAEEGKEKIEGESVQEVAPSATRKGLVTSIQRMSQKAPEDTPVEVISEAEIQSDEVEEAPVEELARQVYLQLKRRLTVEWERGRGRLTK